MTIDEERIKFLMSKLKISREEALELEGYDEDVNKNRKTKYDLTPQQVKIVQEMTRKTDHKKYGPTQKNRKPDDVKIAIMQEIAEFLTEDAQGQVYEDVKLTNVSRMLHFRVGNREFDLQLIGKRPGK